jgi:hypothetical protein
VRCQKTEVGFVCMGNLPDAPGEEEPQHEGSIH